MEESSRRNQEYPIIVRKAMRDALDGVMTKIPMSHATPGLKAHLAEVILQAAAQGLTSHDGLVAAASEQIQAHLNACAD
jgi:hypothetical protein